MFLELHSCIFYIDTAIDTVDVSVIQHILSSFKSYVSIGSHCNHTSTRKFCDICSADNEGEVHFKILFTYFSPVFV